MSESSELVSHEKGVPFMLSRTWLGKTKELFYRFQPVPISKHWCSITLSSSLVSGPSMRILRVPLGSQNSSQRLTWRPFFTDYFRPLT